MCYVLHKNYQMPFLTTRFATISRNDPPHAKTNPHVGLQRTPSLETVFPPFTTSLVDGTKSEFYRAERSYCSQATSCFLRFPSGQSVFLFGKMEPQTDRVTYLSGPKVCVSRQKAARYAQHCSCLSPSVVNL